MNMEFKNVFNSGGMEGAKLVATSKPGDTDNLQVGENFTRSQKKEKGDSLFKGPEQVMIEKIINLKNELSDILNRKPLTKPDREEASAKRNEIKYLENELADYEKSQQN